MVWQKLPKPSTLWEEGEKWFELEDNLEEGKFDFLEYKEEPLPKGIILQRDVSLAMGPETLGTPGDLSRIWVAFTDQETGEIYLARSDAEWNQWEEYLKVIYAPSGSYQPALEFEKSGHYIMTVTLVPAGKTDPEIWLIRYPYSGDGIRRIASGQNSRLGRDVYGEVFLFYQSLDGGQIIYRKLSDNFDTEYLFESSEDEELKPRGFRAITEQISPIQQRYTHLMFYQKGKGGLPRYKKTRPIDFVRVKQIHPLYTNFGQLALGWEGVKYVDFFAKAGDLYTSFGEIGLEWEEIETRTGIKVLVYSNWEDVPVYEINGMVVSNGYVIAGNGLVWVEKGVSSNQDVRCDVWYETGEQARANIILRASANMNSIDGYLCGYIDGFGIWMGKRVNGVHTWIGNVSKNVQPNKWYTARFSAEGSTLRYKIWERGTVEPSAWDLVVSDSSISEGFAGINGGNPDPGRSCKWDNFILNGNLETFNTIKNGSVSGWGTLRDVSSVWHFEAIEELVGYNRVYEIVSNATVRFGNQQAITNQDGLAKFFDLDSNQLYDYEISHPDFEGVSKGTILIPEEEREFIPIRIYNNPWDGFVKGRGIQPSFGNILTLWHQIKYEEIKAKARVKTHASLQSILWVEIES